MITKDIIKIALDTSNEGLKNNYTHKITVKNSLCGDKISLELIIKHSKIKSMKYETESCIYCEASTSLLSKKIINLNLRDIKTYFPILKKNVIKNKIKIPKKLSTFKKLFNSDNINRIKCIILPFNAVLKALK